MKKLKNKTNATMIALFLMLTIAITLVALPVANAHTPSWNVNTWSYITFSPNPVGINQEVLVLYWLNWVPPGAAGTQGGRWQNLTMQVTKPDGSTETVGPFISDGTGAGNIRYTPTELGTYTFTFFFPTQTATGIHPVTGAGPAPEALGIPIGVAYGVMQYGRDYLNDTFLASSATATLTVQEEQIAAPIEPPLPTEYWTRPIEGQNTAWSSIASHWLVGGGPNSNHNIQPYGIAPNSPHIMWTKPIRDGGITGAVSSSDTIGFLWADRYTSQVFQFPIIMNGRLYYDLPLGAETSVTTFGFAGGGAGVVCVDLRTGEQVWWQNWTTPGQVPRFGQIYSYNCLANHGDLPNGWLWAVDGSTWQAFDPLTGRWQFNLTNVPRSMPPNPPYSYTEYLPQIYGPNGEILRYILDYNITTNTGWLACWNNTAAPGLKLGTVGTYGQMWRANGKVVDTSTAYSWNVTIPSLAPNVGGYPFVYYVNYDDILLGTFNKGSKYAGWNPDNPTWTVFAISLKPGSIGQLLWKKDYDTVNNETMYWGLQDPKTRVFTFAWQQSMKWSGYSMDTGEKLWGPVGNETAYNYFTYMGINAYNTGAQIMYDGILYSGGMGGRIYAINDTTGKLLWTYTSDQCDLGSAWPTWPIYMGPIADGKIYTFTFEHTPMTPLRKGAKIHCINKTTGEEIWDIFGWPMGYGHSQMGGITADGYYVFCNYYDSQVYSIGKGPSATTVSVGPKVSVHGSSVLVEGTVIDTAAGTKQKEQAARFPNGVPAMSDASMGEWMEYVYMQKPMPTNATGVEVTLDVIDSNGNYRNIGTATSDANGFFSYMWTPDIPGKYTVIATFAGSESYWGSYAETAFGVSEAPPATAGPEYPQPIDPTWTIVGIGIILLIAIVLVGIWIKRK